MDVPSLNDLFPISFGARNPRMWRWAPYSWYDSIGDLSDVVNVCDAIASYFGIEYLGHIAGFVTKRNVTVAENDVLDVLLGGREEDVVGVIDKTGGMCASGQDSSPYVTDDTEQTSDTIDSCSDWV